MKQNEIKKEILNKIKEYETIIIARHVRPDGDCMASSLGLREIIKASFKDKKVYSIGFQKANYLNFIGLEDDDVDIEVYKNSLVIVVDTSNSDRIDNQNYKYAKEIIKIDHHIGSDNYGTINYVEEDVAACALMIVDFYDTFKSELKLTKEASLALFVGIVTDTGRFRYKGVDKEAFMLASILLSYDLDLEYIYANLYMKEMSSLKLQGEIYRSFKMTENKVAYMFISRKMQKKFQLTPEDAASLVNSMDSIRGSLIWIMFIEQLDKSIRVRIRSRFVAINTIGEKFNGGGHLNAAGAVVYNKKEMKELVMLADSALKEYKEKNQGWL